MFEKTCTYKQRLSFFFCASVMKHDRERKNLIKDIFFLSFSIFFSSTLELLYDDRKGCFIIMSDLRLTIEDMIACILFVDVIHVASLELVERIKYTNTYAYIYKMKKKNRTKKNMHNFFFRQRFFFFPFRFFS